MKKETPIKLEIPKPCTENWNSMSPTEKGRHCEKCATIVTDFSKMSDGDIINFLAEGKGSGCGNFKNSQINRSIQKDLPVKHYGQGFIPALFSAAFSLFIHQNASAQDHSTKLEGTEYVTPIATENIEVGVKSASPTSISGVIVSAEDKEGVPFALIWIEGTKVGMQTDFDGNFSIDIPPGMTLDEIVLVASSLGFKQVSFCPQRTAGLEIKLENSAVEIKGLYIYEEIPKTQMGRLLTRSKYTLLAPMHWVRRKMAN